MGRKRYITTIFLVFCVWLARPSHAGAAEVRDYSQAVNGLASKSRSTILKSIDALGELGDENTLPALEALMDRRLYRADDDRAVMVSADGARVVYADKGEAAGLDPSTLSQPIINNRVRRALKPLMASLRIFSPSVDVRRQAAEELSKDPRPEIGVTLRKALARETDDQVKEALVLTLALTGIKSEDLSVKLAAIKTLGESGNPAFIPMLDWILEENGEGAFVETDKNVIAAAQSARSSIRFHMGMVGTAQDLYYGFSLGSILLLAALGLAITFGLMGVINMAHGEMLMLGAFSWSQGLEAAVDTGWVTDEHQAESWVRGLLVHSLGRLDVPVMMRMHRAWAVNDAVAVHDWNAYVYASRPSREFRMEDMQMGQALKRLLTNLGLEEPHEIDAERPTFAMMYALAGVRWDLDAASTSGALAWSFLENQVAAAVKLVPLGQSAGQKILARLCTLIPEVLKTAESLADDDLGAFAPSLSLLSAMHEVQHTRLFRS